jgi:hypothetical protein
MDLVGAPPMKEPHGKLLPAEKDTEASIQFRCTECGFRWSVSALGWWSVWD